MTLPIGRFAPTPSGPLHFGSLVAALASYCDVRAQRGQWLLRIEDVDTPRVVAGASEQILRDLEAFGFDWDGAVLYQSSHFDEYRDFLDLLFKQGDCFACACSRRKLREQGVRSGPLGQIYPGNCRARNLASDGRAIRLLTGAAGVVAFHDRVYGNVALDLPVSVGDFVLRRNDYVYAYHLAVVVDDELQGVNQVVRGADLLENTCLHIYLQQRLGFGQPEYMHVPLVNNADGVKLSKQTGARALAHEHAPRLLLAASRHLGQQPPDDLDGEKPQAILDWCWRHWNPGLVPTRVPPRARRHDD